MKKSSTMCNRAGSLSALSSSISVFMNAVRFFGYCIFSYYYFIKFYFTCFEMPHGVSQ